MLTRQGFTRAGGMNIQPCSACYGFRFINHNDYGRFNFEKNNKLHSKNEFYWRNNYIQRF